MALQYQPDPEVRVRDDRTWRRRQVVLDDRRGAGNGRQASRCCSTSLMRRCASGTGTWRTQGRNRAADAATCGFYKLAAGDLVGRLFADSGRDRPCVIARYNGHRQVVVDEELIAGLVAETSGARSTCW